MLVIARLIVLILIIAVTAAPGFGQEASESELAKAAQNPVASLISLASARMTKHRMSLIFSQFGHFP